MGRKRRSRKGRKRRRRHSWVDCKAQFVQQSPNDQKAFAKVTHDGENSDRGRETERETDRHVQTIMIIPLPSMDIWKAKTILPPSDSWLYGRQSNEPTESTRMQRKPI